MTNLQQKKREVTAYAVVIGKEIESIWLVKRWAQEWAKTSNWLDRKIVPKLRLHAKVVKCKIIINI